MSIALDLIYVYYKTRDYSYKSLEKNAGYIENKFKPYVYQESELTGAFGNETVQLLYMDYKDSFQVIVFNLSGLNDLNIEYIELALNDRFDYLDANAVSLFGWGEGIQVKKN